MNARRRLWVWTAIGVPIPFVLIALGITDNWIVWMAAVGFGLVVLAGEYFLQVRARRSTR